MTQTPNKPFTGSHMAGFLIGGFAVVATVNIYMASLATGGFHGTVVDNSYVASQKFNKWLEKAEAAKALGWSALIEREDTGHVLVITEAVPQGALVSAELRRPIGTREYQSLTFSPLGDGRFRSVEEVASGRWTMRLFIQNDGQEWAEESELSH